MIAMVHYDPKTDFVNTPFPFPRLQCKSMKRNSLVFIDNMAQKIRLVKILINI